MQLVGSAQHAFANRTAQLAFFNLVKLRFGGVNLGAYLGAYHLLTGSHVGSTTDDVQRLFAAHVHSGQVQVVAVGVRFAGQHLGDDHMFQSALDAFHLFYIFYFKPAESQQVVEFIRGEVGIDILTQPFIGYLHD